MNEQRRIDPTEGKTQVSVHEAKTHLSRLLARVEAGEEIIVKRGAVPVARLAPLVPPTRPKREAGRLAHLVPPGRGDILSHGFWDPLTPEEMGLDPDEVDEEAGGA